MRTLTTTMAAAVALMAVAPAIAAEPTFAVVGPIVATAHAQPWQAHTRDNSGSKHAKGGDQRTPYNTPVWLDLGPRDRDPDKGIAYLRGFDPWGGIPLGMAGEGAKNVFSASALAKATGLPAAPLATTIRQSFEVEVTIPRAEGEADEGPKEVALPVAAELKGYVNGACRMDLRVDGATRGKVHPKTGSTKPEDKTVAFEEPVLVGEGRHKVDIAYTCSPVDPPPVMATAGWLLPDGFKPLKATGPAPKFKPSFAFNPGEFTTEPPSWSVARASLGAEDRTHNPADCSGCFDQEMFGKLPAGSVESTRSIAAYDKGRQAADEHGALGVQAKAVFTPNVPGRWRFALVAKVGKVRSAYPVAQSALLLEGDKGWEAAVVLGGGELPAPKDTPAERTVVAVGSVEVTEHDAKYGRKAILLLAGLEDRGRGPAYAQETELWVRGPGEHVFRPATAAEIRWEKDRW